MPVIPSLSLRLSALAVAGLATALSGCPGNDYATDGCSAGDAPPVENFWAGPGVTDVTFLAFGDSQVYPTSANPPDGGGKNDLHVQALNVADGLDWGALGVEQPVSNIRGVLMAGDIVQNGRDSRGVPFGEADEYGDFVQNYGLCGNRVLRFPIFEGYGNHDYFEFDNVLYTVPKEHPVADSVSIRNPHRVGLVNEAPGTDGHYSWDWDNVHFINVNLAPSDTVPADPPREGVRDPRSALTYLQADLASTPTDKPVVVMMHYGVTFTTFEWDQAQIDDFAAAVAGHNVIAIVHGHAHATWTSNWEGIKVFNLGSPYYDDNQTYNRDNRGHFSVFRITDDKLYAYDASWDPNDPTSLQGPDVGGWSWVVDIS